MNPIHPLLFVASLSIVPPLIGQTVIKLPGDAPSLTNGTKPLPGGWYVNMLTTKPFWPKVPKRKRIGTSKSKAYAEHQIVVRPWLIASNNAGGTAFAHARLKGGGQMVFEFDTGAKDADVWTFEVLFDGDPDEEGFPRYCDPKAGADAGVNFKLTAWNSFKNNFGNPSTPWLAASYAAHARTAALQRVKIRANGTDVAQDSDGVDVASTAQSGPIVVTYGGVQINLKLAAGWNKTKGAIGLDQALVSLGSSTSASAIFKSEGEVRAKVKHTSMAGSAVEARAEAKGLSYANITLSSALCDTPYPEEEVQIVVE